MEPPSSPQNATQSRIRRSAKRSKTSPAGGSTRAGQVGLLRPEHHEARERYVRQHQKQLNQRVDLPPRQAGGCGRLNLGVPPPNPFGSPEFADLMDQLKVLGRMERTAPDHPYTLSGGPTAYQLQDEIAKLADVVVNEFSRAMRDNEAREEALKAMRLDDCLEIYTPGVLGPSGLVPGAPGEPTKKGTQSSARSPHGS